MSRQRLIARLLKASQSMVQGGLSETSRRCGNPNCVCRRDPARLHGPNLYITYRVDGKGRSLYVPAGHAPSARKAQQAWSCFWETGCAIAALNREQLQKQFQRDRRTRKISARSVPRD
jgi:hypothetical protein